MLQQQIEKFLLYLTNEKRASVHTVVSYETDLTQFTEFLALNNIENTIHIKPIYIRNWIVDLMESGKSSRTVNRKITTLKSFYKFLCRKGVVEENPTAKVVTPKTKKRLPVFVEQNNILNLFEQIEFSNNFVGKRDKLILLLFYSTGIRLSELINIKEKNIFNNSIKVLGKRNKERLVPITNNLLEEIKHYISIRNKEVGRNEFLFVTNKNKKIYEKLVYGIVNNYLSKVTTVEKKSPHVLRHTFATHMLNNGADLNTIKEILGHANLSATEVYTHNTFEKLKSIYKQAHPRA